MEIKRLMIKTQPNQYDLYWLQSGHFSTLKAKNYTIGTAAEILLF